MSDVINWYFLKNVYNMTILVLWLENIEVCIYNYAETIISNSDLYVGNTESELCLPRSADNTLDTSEQNWLINHFCTLLFIRLLQCLFYFFSVCSDYFLVLYDSIFFLCIITHVLFQINKDIIKIIIIISIMLMLIIIIIIILAYRI